MIRKLVPAIGGLAIGLLLAGVLTRAAYAATCSVSQDYDCDKGYAGTWTKNDGTNMMSRANFDVYMTGGGWFINENKSWSLGTPTRTPHPQKGYSGLDCSGYVFKAWGMRYSPVGSTGSWIWNDDHDAHGPYQAPAIKGGCSGACPQICGDGAVCNQKTLMDVYARYAAPNILAHVAIFVSYDLYGNETIGEAGGFTGSTGLMQTHVTNYYRQHPAFSMVRRLGWP